MPEDRSLDEFGGSDAATDRVETEPAETDPGETEPADDDSAAAESDGDAVEGGDGDDGSDRHEGGDGDEVTPATATATWTAGGADCERCGDRVERRWLDDGDRVCPDCKSW
ncbi:hypothetical protein CK500_08525 [Halorubrum salipaludis]|uniref:DUF7573 domain-containing protein n=1 Tax=Halorubrum salipaludis TaxID=2032630 RepID=A0A2A2FDI6_9EURY|nr:MULTISPECIES: hypothetical protein [Halorubrum]PAU83551.1 hypothetical protein CK500_08525 [Halorubrum salipaludis]